MRGFRDRKAASEYWLMTVATFLCFATMQQTALLAVVLGMNHLSRQQIGVVLSAYGAAVVPFSFAAGPLAVRFGNLAVVRFSLALMLAAYASCEVTVTSFPGALISRLFMGVGYGFFLPPALAFVRTKLSEEQLIYRVGVFASMVVLPNAVAPVLAELYLKTWGDRWFFVIGSLPLALALVLTLGLSDSGGVARELPRRPVLSTVLLPSLRRPLIAILVVGGVYGLTLSYMAPLLLAAQVPVGYFYTCFTVVMFGSRFLLMSSLAAKVRTSLLAAGLATMGASYLVIAFLPYRLPVALAGIAFGLGYSIAYPTISVWVSEQFPPAERATPLAVFNAMFSLGILLTPWFGAYIIGAIGYVGLLELLAAVAVLPLPYLLTPYRGAAPLTMPAAASSGRGD